MENRLSDICVSHSQDEHMQHIAQYTFEHIYTVTSKMNKNTLTPDKYGKINK